MVVQAMIDFATTAPLRCRQTTDLRYGPILSHGARWCGDAVANETPMTPIDGHMGRRIRGKRRALGLSEDDLARALGVGEWGIRERARRGEPVASGVRVLRAGVKYLVPTDDVLRVLGITRDVNVAGPAPPGPATTPTEAAPTPRTTTTHDDTAGSRHSA